MIKHSIAAVAAVLIFVSCASAQPFASVAPVQEIRLDVETGTSSLSNVCGAVSINQTKRYWLTAAHCLYATPEEGTSYIRGDEVLSVMRDEINDLAIVQTRDVSAPAVKRAPTALKLGDTVFTISYPMLSLVPFHFVGTVANAGFEHGQPFVGIQFPVAPGSSGSPIFNANYELVSVVQRGYAPHGYAPVGAGVGFEKIEALDLWWEK